MPINAETLRAEREALGYSRALFAKLVGKTSITVARWERGDREISTMANTLIWYALKDQWRQRAAHAGTYEQLAAIVYPPPPPPSRPRPPSYVNKGMLA